VIRSGSGELIRIPGEGCDHPMAFVAPGPARAPMGSFKLGRLAQIAGNGVKTPRAQTVMVRPNNNLLDHRVRAPMLTETTVFGIDQSQGAFSTDTS